MRVPSSKLILVLFFLYLAEKAYSESTNDGSTNTGNTVVEAIPETEPETLREPEYLPGANNSEIDLRACSKQGTECKGSAYCCGKPSAKCENKKCRVCTLRNAVCKNSKECCPWDLETETSFTVTCDYYRPNENICTVHRSNLVMTLNH